MADKNVENVGAELSNMSKADWDKFFVLVEKIVESGEPVSEKTAAVVEQARQRGGSIDMNFEEFASWDFHLFIE